ncbi:PfaB family protein [Aetokthonos hydrillicola Thurmond2011]|jgi:PfaB family protein|uniref:PfaB family protein n=1 Tax=Aetokthonos hydrillicola Thurmond2011 TaxID=2712845 RepID=A0AAP5M9P2_9CYAN|nr:PfaB family protein [Aetokthonos hydrillicola]MBO3461044.1 PfaB family protein [Aetokthonos hydrillicola CCALA 1050]MBW4586297.1 PfaB family protein [Aetokthonos hydrillicola CCALA 1050]MDR9897425.1 PfaB family protein [Aetokthonos hydrillicola Thurmond2011]
MEKIAIIGYSCLFPDAKNPEEFWQNLIQQKDSTVTLSIEETGIDPNVFYNPEKGQADKIYSLKGAFIRNFKFDPTGYNLPTEFLESLDNTFKWSLDVAKQALQHSGYLGKEDILSKCGVILGSLSLPTKFSNQLLSPIYQEVLSSAVRELLQYEDFDLASLRSSANASTYNAMISGLPAAIIAQALSLSSIHFCLDAACSSPQYAMKLASHYLWTHKADLMLAGGISCADPLFIRMLFSGIQGYPEDNDISRPFDKSSRGLITADGVGMVVLKRYSDAVRDGDRIYGTICGNGLSNDGKGKHLLSPNSKGQILAFERAYQEAQITPKDIDYMECHATGTLLGDTTESSSVETFFGKHQATPLVGSVKSNVGHLLTAAGSVSVIKVLLSMSKGVIPATINVANPIGDQNSVISPQRIVTSTTNWSSKTSIKRAAISAFGLGGTNAHMILEEGTTGQIVGSSEPLQPVKMAIVGMDAFFGGCNGLDAFERSIYEGKQHFISLPPNRWYGIDNQEDLLKKYGLTDGKPPVGAYIQEFEIDTISSKIPPNELSKLNPQQLLLLKVAERALKDAGIKEGANVAVLIAAETEFSVHQLQQRWNLSWQIEQGLKSDGISLPAETTSQLETVVKDGIHNPVESSEYVSYISNIMASRISALWDFTAPSFTITAGENSTFKVLEIAQHLLTTGEADAVLVGAIDLAGGVENVLLRNQLAAVNTGVATLSYDQKANGWIVGEGAGAVVLKRHETAKKESDRIYSVIDAISFAQDNQKSENLQNRLTTPDANAINSVCQQALQTAGIQGTDVEYLEVFGSGVKSEDEAEIQGLLQAYPGDRNNLSCAIGSVKANIGHTYVASGIASLIKTALCLYYRYIPATPKWSGVKNTEQWQDSPFYVATESRPWFLAKDANKRVAAVNSMGIDGSYAHLIVSEEPDQQQRNSRYLEQMPFYLFPLAASDRAELLEQLSALQTTIENSTSLGVAAKQTFTTYKQRSDANYALAILGRNKNELTKEVEAARKGVNNAFERSEDWQTPLGSYFTAKPLGKKGEVAYVYPAAVNSYIGIARNLFRLFPKIHDDIAIKSLPSLVADISKLIFPRSLNKLSTRQLESLEKQLLDDSLAIFDTDMIFTRFITAIMRDDFQVKPKFVFGYSLGETSMMSAAGVWTHFSQGIEALHASPLFVDRLSADKNAVREYWGLPSVQEFPDNNFWSNYVILATPSQVLEYLKHENRVYLTQINTPEEVVIAGDPTACERVIKKLGCNFFRAPFDHVIHCDAMRSEYGEIARVNTLPANDKISDIVIYSASEYAPIKLESQAIAHSIAKCLCEQLDFPRLVNRVYEDGARIFIEAGAGGVCSRWIDKNLEGKEHITVTLNRRGVDDHASIIKALAKLLSHRVSLDLSPLYTQSQEASRQSKLTTRTVVLGGNSITSKILNEENLKLFENISNNLQLYRSAVPLTDSLHKTSNVAATDSNTSPLNSQQEEVNMKHAFDNSFEPKEELQFDESYVNQHLDGVTQQYGYSVTSPEFIDSHYQKLTTNNSRVTKAHAAFLKSRQEFSQQISELIQLQIICAQNLLNR